MLKLRQYAPLLCLLAWSGMSGVLAQEFHERMSDWPSDLRIRGMVMAAADGQVSRQQLDYLVRASGGANTRVVWVSFGAAGMPSIAETLNSQVSRVDYYWVSPETGIPQPMNLTDSAETTVAIQDALSQATAVCLNSDGSLNSARRACLLKWKVEWQAVIDRGGVVFGSGPVSGSLGKHEILGGQFMGDSRMASLASALNLIPDTVLQTDFQTTTAKPRLLSVLAAHPRSIGVGLDPETTLVLQGRKIRALGGGQLHFFTMANERSPLRSKSIREPVGRRSSPYDYLVDLTAWRRDAIDRTRDPFPPQEPQVPTVQNGTLMIVGGGGLPEGLMDQFIERAGGQQARLVYIPCTERASLTPGDMRLVQLWRNKGVASADVVHTKDRNVANSDEDFLRPLQTATGIFFGGGRQWNFADSYYGTEAHRLMKGVLQRGGVIAGSSAGASIQAEYLARANPLGNLDIMAEGYERGGLGFLSGVAIDQHFTQRKRQPDMSRLVNRYPQLLGIGIDERTALIVRHSTAEVVGIHDVYFYDRSQQAAHDQPDYLKLSAGEKYDLAERKVLE